jgi:hypothetical protein
VTSLQERAGFSSDPIDRVADDADAPFVVGYKVSDVGVTQPATVAGVPDVERPHRFAVWVRLVLRGGRHAFARPPKQPRREKKHYPPRFSAEFETSLVDRERRRL